MLKRLLCLYLFLFFAATLKCQLKSIIYDFDGLDIGQTNLPEGDYRKNDLTMSVAANPFGVSDMLGDRVLKLNLQWSSGIGIFGRGISRFYELNPSADRLNFYFYNPTTNAADASVDVVITEDDDQSNNYSINNDDTWKRSLTISRSSGWQLISIPLNTFSDSNAGGNGVFDASYTGNTGMILMVELQFKKNTTASETFYLDMLCFSEGPLPVGSSMFNLPPSTMAGKCPLGAFEQKARGQEYTIPTDVEGFFAPTDRKIKYVNWFIQFAMDGSTTAKELPGSEVTKLLSAGYRPIITWEPLFQGYSRLDPVQPRLDNIINGQYNSYIDAFADKIKSYNDTIVIRFMHEFEGDWYPWSIVYNNQDPNKYITAFRTVVNRFRNRGATKVKWMWCLNADYHPYRAYNWVIASYPGDSYVDIVATDVYNSHYPDTLPWWMSFKYKAIETYYYLTKYIPNKPLMICEVGCRERKSTENPNSETKGQWLAKMDKELQSTFSHVKSLVFFSAAHVGDWRINSSQAALDAVKQNIWNDDYYFEDTGGTGPPPSTCSATGSILREYWANVTATSLSGAPFNSAPTSTSQLSIFEGPKNVGDNYASRIRGYVCPPVTGNYVFWIASDNQSELWISTNDNPANKIKRASVSDWTNSREWTKYSTQQSAPISLTAGTKYYIEAIHREGTQGDHLEVGWQLANGTLERPIPGNRLSPYEGGASPPATTCTATIRPGGSTTFCNGGSVTLYANTGSGLSYQWIKSGAAITGANTSSYNATAAGDYQVKVSASGCTDWSAPVKVAVNSTLTAKITAGGPTSFCSGSNVTLYANTCSGYIYQWKKDGADIPGATASSYVATTSGNYQVKIIQGSSAAWSAQMSVTAYACKQSDSASVASFASRPEATDTSSVSITPKEDFKIVVYPNPTTGVFTFQLCMEDMPNAVFGVKVMNTLGQVVYTRPDEPVNGCIHETIELSNNLMPGIYTLQLKIGETTENTSILLTNR